MKFVWSKVGIGRNGVMESRGKEVEVTGLTSAVCENSVTKDVCDALTNVVTWMGCKSVQELRCICTDEEGGKEGGGAEGGE